MSKLLYLSVQISFTIYRNNHHDNHMFLLFLLLPMNFVYHFQVFEIIVFKFGSFRHTKEILTLHFS